MEEKEEEAKTRIIEEVTKAGDTTVAKVGNTKEVVESMDNSRAEVASI